MECIPYIGEQLRKKIGVNTVELLYRRYIQLIVDAPKVKN